jgi:hypothetical protein
MFVSQIFDECAEILGTTDEKKIFRKISQAVATLMESGHWTHSVADVDVCTGWDRCSITLPRGIDVPLAVNIDGSPTYFRNRLFQYHVNKGGMFNSVEWAWDDRGYTATLMDIIQPSQLVAVAEMENDVGKTIRVLGTDQDNRTIRSQLANGTGVDGLLVPIHSQSDFAYGTIAPDDATIKTRSVAITPINLFRSSAAHGLSSGQGMSVTATSGAIPVSLENGQTYYIGVIDAYTVQLFNDPLNAQALQYPINFKSIVGAGNFEFKDSRDSQVVTALKLSDAPAFSVDAANQITFPAQQLLPSPLKSETTYYANLIDSIYLNIFASQDDAKKNINPIYTTGNTDSLNVDIRKKIDPQTTLTFPVKHYYKDGDQVQAYTASGNLPQPLIENQNYFVNVINNYTISLHLNKTDALSSDPVNLVNPIVLKDSGSGTNSIVKLIPATVTTGTTAQITAPTLNIEVPNGSGAQFQAVPVGSVVSVTITNGGSGYGSAPTVEFSAPPTQPSGSTIVTETAIGQAIVVGGVVTQVVIISGGLGYVNSPLPSITFTGGGGGGATATAKVQTSFISGYTKINGGYGYTEPPQIKISGGGGTGATAIAKINSSTLNVSSITVSSGVATATTTTNHGYSASQTVVISGATGSNAGSYNGPRTIVSTTSNTFTFNVTPVTTNDASGTIQVYSGEVTEVVSVTNGVGYTSTPSTIITPSTGVFISFTSTGTLPSPLVSGTAYRAEIPLDTDSGNFTVKNADFSDVNITSSGTGTVYVSLSRSFGVTFNNNWVGDFSNLATGQKIYFGTDYLLPNTNPSIDNGVTAFYINKINNTTAKIYNNSENSIIGSLTGIINVLSFGSGQSYYALRKSFQSLPYGNLITPSGIEYLNENEIVQFSTTQTLPSPLISATNYTIKLSGNSFKVYLNEVLQVLTTPGSGQLKLDIIRTFNVSESTSIDADQSQFNTGDSVIPSAKEEDVLPTGLTSGTTYYARRIDNNSFELYDTQSQAKNTSSTIGRKSYTTTGQSVDSTFFIDSVTFPVFVKSVSQIDKPITEGYVSLYAYDYGRSNDMTLIGQYHPSEVNPQYRRIRVGKPCAWARISYRIQTPSITSIYDFIPLEQERAIITAVHACDLEDKDFADQSGRYWQIAFSYLKNQQESIDGHAMVTPQINNVCYGDESDPVMF